MIYLTDDIAELIVKEHATAVQQAARHARRMDKAQTPPHSRCGDEAMIWIASGLAAAFALVLWL